MYYHYTDLELDALARQIAKRGFFFYRFNYYFGQVPSLKNNVGDEYFIDGKDILTPVELHERVNARWHPYKFEECEWRDMNLAGFPKLQCPGPWQGVGVDEMLAADAAEKVIGGVR